MLYEWDWPSIYPIEFQLLDLCDGMLVSYKVEQEDAANAFTLLVLQSSGTGPPPMLCPSTKCAPTMLPFKSMLAGTCTCMYTYTAALAVCAQVSPSATIDRDLGLDSLDMVELVRSCTCRVCVWVFAGLYLRHL